MNHIQHHDALRLHADDRDARSKVAAAVDVLLAAERPRARGFRSRSAATASPPTRSPALITGLRRLRERRRRDRGRAGDARPCATRSRSPGSTASSRSRSDPTSASAGARSLLGRLTAASFAAVAGARGAAGQRGRGPADRPGRDPGQGAGAQPEPEQSIRAGCTSTCG